MDILYIYSYTYYLAQNSQYIPRIYHKGQRKMKQTKKSPLDTANGNITNRENRQSSAAGTVTALLLLQLPICAISSTQQARVLLSLASGKHPSVKMWKLQCPWEKALASIKSCNPIKFHQTSLRLIFKINNRLMSTINICWCSSILALFKFTESDVFPHISSFATILVENCVFRVWLVS